ncbi:MAG: YhcH/YjgK/YiaL family protein [SAR202 cluster bacterium]|nr:YhcH/YjgK/YiaL family protein [SAR202 cluster bacterium]
MEAGLIKQFEQYARKNNIPEVYSILTDPGLADFTHQDLKMGAAKRFEVAGGRDIYLMFQIVTTQAHDDAFFEAHRDYIDIHVPIEGVESIGYAPLDARLSPGGPLPDYDASASDDVTFSHFDSPHEMTVVRLVEGMYGIFYPDDAHIPRLQTNGPSYLRKMVIKVPVSLVERPEDQTTSPPSGTILSELLV